MWQFNPYAIPLFIGIIPVSVFAWIAWQHRTNLAARFFFFFALASANYMLTYGLELSSTSLPVMMIWLRLEYISSLSIPVIWLLFHIAYSGYESWITRRNIILLFIVPILHLLAVWTNDYHGLNWQTVGTQTVSGYIMFARTYGPMFYIGTGYLYVIALVANVVMFVWMVRSPNVYRNQIASLMLGTLTIWVTSILTVAGITPVPGLDLTPFGFALACIPIAWSLFYNRLFNIMPAARGAIIKGMSDAVLVFNDQDIIVDANPAAAVLIGHELSQLIGKPAVAAFARTPDLVERYRNIHEAQGELEIPSSTGSLYFDMRISPLYDRTGRLTARIVVLRDVTRTKHAETIIRQYAAELELRNQELDAFSYSVAHDLRTPITTVIGYSDILQSMEADNLSERGRSYMEKIHRSAHKMSDMTIELLRLASMRDVTSALVSVSVTPVAQSAVERFRADIEARTIIMDIMPEMPAALGQPVWLEEIFANLISNAIKYIGKDNACPRISIRGFQQGNVVRYEVQDNGLGIDTEDQAKLFDLFSRFHTGEASGLGMGLSIFLRIVSRLKGQVGVESVLGKGSTFWFTLPAP